MTRAAEALCVTQPAVTQHVRALERELGTSLFERTGRSREVAALALAREIDLGLVTSPVQHPDLCLDELFEEEIVLVAPPGHALAARTVLAEEMAEAPLILFPHGTGFRDYLDRA